MKKNKYLIQKRRREVIKADGFNRCFNERKQMFNMWAYDRALERKIMKCVDEEIKPHWGKLWGQKHWCVPAYCGIIEGDGRQVVWLKTGDSRPNYYILRIDSKTDVESDDFNIELLYSGIEDEFGNVDDYEEEYIDNIHMARHKYHDDDDEPWLPYDEVMCFPALSTSNGAFWGKVKIF